MMPTVEKSTHDVPLREWWPRSSPNKISAHPWLHPAVTMYLDVLIQPHWKIIEHGSGGSTLWFGQKAKSVLSIEHDDAWLRNVAVAAAGMELNNVEMLKGLTPADVDFISTGFDLLLVDGQRKARPYWIEAAPLLVRPGGIVVFDNCNRPAYRQARNFMQGYATHYIYFMVNAPGHEYTVTEMYRMPGGTKNERWI